MVKVNSWIDKKPDMGIMSKVADNTLFPINITTNTNTTDMRKLVKKKNGLVVERECSS